MWRRSILFLLIALPALAQERWQVGLAVTDNGATRMSYLGGGTSGASFNRQASAGIALNGGVRFLDFASSDLSATLDYQFKRRSPLGVTITGQSYRSNIYDSYTAPGVQWNWHSPFDAGFGFQYRMERLQNVITNANYNRPWVLGYVGKTFDTGSNWRPYVALRVGIALRTTGRPALDNQVGGIQDSESKQLLRSLDGNAELALQGGFRF